MVQCDSFPSPFGPIIIGWEDDAVVSLRLAEAFEGPPASSAVSDLAALQLQEYFSGQRQSFTFPMKLQGTPFQLSVWHELARIPYGQTRTYQEIALAIGRPKAVRAVGMACSRNPLWIAIPCHRVLGRNRSLTGYAGGLTMKQALLELEARYRNNETSL